MSDETWLIGRKVDASKKIFVVTGILVLDFELFIGGRCQNKSWQLSKATSSQVLIDCYD